VSNQISSVSDEYINMLTSGSVYMLSYV